VEKPDHRAPMDRTLCEHRHDLRENPPAVLRRLMNAPDPHNVGGGGGTVCGGKPQPRKGLSSCTVTQGPQGVTRDGSSSLL